jgi:hypothetical protein
MGNDTRAWLRKLGKAGFKGYEKNQFKVIYGSRRHKVYFRIKGTDSWVPVGSFALTPSDVKSLTNAINQLKKNIADVMATHEGNESDRRVNLHK